MHELKTWPQFFQAIVDGRKNFEVRYDDRGYQAGDHVLLREYESDLVERYSGRTISARIGYVLAHPSGRRGEHLNGYVVFSLLDIKVEHRPGWTMPATARPVTDQKQEQTDATGPF